MNKYNCNEIIFAENNEISFYWAGFFAADGNVSRNGDINLGVAHKDIDHLIKFQQCIASNAPIKTITKKNRIIDGVSTPKSQFSLIRFRSKQMAQDIEKFGVIPNKTKTYSIPKWVSDHELFIHFIRGYFDGDGWFTLRNHQKDRKRIAWGLCGNLSVITTIKNFLIDKAELNSNPKIRSQKSIFRFEFNKQNDVLKITNYMYNNSSLFLNRKREIAKLAETCNNETVILNIEKVKLLEAYNRLKSYRLVALEFNCAVSSVANYMKKYELNNWE